MSTVLSGAENEKTKIYETVLSSPGMNEKCKITLHLSGQTILLLSQLIENGLSIEDKNPAGLLHLLPKESAEELDSVVPELLKRAGLSDFYSKLMSL